MSYSILQPDDGTFRFSSGNDAIPDLIIGGSATPTAASPRFMVPRVAKIVIAASDIAGGILSWQTPADFPIIVERIVFDVTHASTFACTVDVGHTTVSAATTSDTLMDGLDVSTAGAYDNIADKGTNGKSRQKIPASKWITASMASGAAAGLIGYAYIHYYPAVL